MRQLEPASQKIDLMLGAPAEAVVLPLLVGRRGLVEGLRAIVRVPEREETGDGCQRRSHEDADENLYKSKLAGRNCVTSAKPLPRKYQENFDASAQNHSVR